MPPYRGWGWHRTATRPRGAGGTSQWASRPMPPGPGSLSGRVFTLTAATGDPAARRGRHAGGKASDRPHAQATAVTLSGRVSPPTAANLGPGDRWGLLARRGHHRRRPGRLRRRALLPQLRPVGGHGRKGPGGRHLPAPGLCAHQGLAGDGGDLRPGGRGGGVRRAGPCSRPRLGAGPRAQEPHRRPVAPRPERAAAPSAGSRSWPAPAGSTCPAGCSSRRPRGSAAWRRRPSSWPPGRCRAASPATTSTGSASSPRTMPWSGPSARAGRDHRRRRHRL